MIPLETPLGTLVIIAHKPSNVAETPIWVEPDMDMLLGKVGRIISKIGPYVHVDVEGQVWAYSNAWLDIAVLKNGHAQGNTHIDQELPP